MSIVLSTALGVLLGVAVVTVVAALIARLERRRARGFFALDRPAWEAEFGRFVDRAAVLLGNTEIVVAGLKDDLDMHGKVLEQLTAAITDLRGALDASAADRADLRRLADARCADCPMRPAE